MPAEVTSPIFGRARRSLTRSGSILSLGIGAPGSSAASGAGDRDSAIPVGILSSRSTTRHRTRLRVRCLAALISTGYGFLVTAGHRPISTREKPLGVADLVR